MGLAGAKGDEDVMMGHTLQPALGAENVFVGWFVQLLKLNEILPLKHQTCFAFCRSSL